MWKTIEHMGTKYRLYIVKGEVKRVSNGRFLNHTAEKFQSDYPNLFETLVRKAKEHGNHRQTRVSTSR
jgi:hypothetical protein